MKRTKPEKRLSAARQRRVPRTVDEYIAGIPESSRSNFDVLRSAIRSVVPPDSNEVISYGIPAFKAKKVLVWFAAFSQHCSLFPTASVIEAFRDELENFAISKGTVQFPNDKPLPIVLVKKLVKRRVAQNKAAAEHHQKQ
jgi:uncharacterized protein YdhG (YjbR/CyaY superfamily)